MRVSESGWAVFHCPGCECGHRILVQAVGGPMPPNPIGHHVWQWNGSLEAPTLTPSLNIPGECHSFVNGGRIQFLPDSTHKLAGQTVDIPDWE